MILAQASETIQMDDVYFAVLMTGICMVLITLTLVATTRTQTYLAALLGAIMALGVFLLLI